MDKFLKPIELIEFSAAPSNPSAGSQKVYAKTDGKVYRLNSAGIEVELTNTAGGGLSAAQVLAIQSLRF